MNSRKKIIENIKWCTNCLAMSTRPRISFDSQGKCGACRWSEEKKKIDWQIREKKLESIFKIQKAKKKAFDCLVPVSGGKDGSYVSYMVKEKYGMKPLCVTVKPALSSKLGEENLKNFIDSGYQHISISPSVSGMQKLNKNGLIEMGSPYFGWLILQANPEYGGQEWNINDGRIIRVPFPLTVSLQDYKSELDKHFLYYGR